MKIAISGKGGVGKTLIASLLCRVFAEAGRQKLPEIAQTYLALKPDWFAVTYGAGGEFIMTQLFYDNKDYFNYVKKVREAGINLRIIPGIMPIPNWQGLVKFTSNCGASIPQFVADIFRPLDGNDGASYRRGVDFAVEQCQELLDGGAPGLHFFTMNRVNPTAEIVSRLKIKR